ncbi:MAG: dihydroorotate dehydrogenase electron transfer subunit [Dehalococcoidia bacterium]|nr:dihydroorotate dehydrogenase electron transfer subunit [Dehalococcoidia bacterium]
MNVVRARIVSNERLFGRTHLVWLHAPPLAKGASPGQFLMFRILNGSDPLLGRPMSYHGVRKGAEGDEVALLYQVWGRATALLAKKAPGDEVLAWGPLGRGYAVAPRARNLLLVAGGMGTAPLVWLAEQAVAKGKNVSFIIGVRTAEQTAPVRSLPPQAELVIVTEDGSLGRKGLVTEPFAESLSWADQVFACGPRPMYESMAQVVRKARSRTPVQVLLETNMACGIGLCYGCAIETRRGVKQVCRDGPRFELREIF